MRGKQEKVMHAWVHKPPCGLTHAMLVPEQEEKQDEIMIFISPAFYNGMVLNIEYYHNIDEIPLLWFLRGEYGRGTLEEFPL